MVGTLTATISAYPSEPPRSVVTDRFNPWAQDGGGGSVASFFCVRFDVVIVIRGRGDTAKKLVEREEIKKRNRNYCHGSWRGLATGSNGESWHL